jgi:hypothetical protein
LAERMRGELGQLRDVREVPLADGGAGVRTRRAVCSACGTSVSASESPALPAFASPSSPASFTTEPMPFERACRPVSKRARLGLQVGTVHACVKSRPSRAKASSAGVAAGVPGARPRSRKRAS